MSDFASSLPIRTENNGDVAIKVVDSTITSQGMKVEADGSINTNSTVTATDLDIRDLAFATDKVDVTGSEVSLDSATLAALESITVQNGAGAAAVNIQDGGNSITVDAVDLDIRDLTSASDSVSVLQATHDSLNANVTIQVADVDVSNANPVPVSDAGGSITVDAVDLDIRNLSTAQDSVAADIRIGGNPVTTLNPVPVVVSPDASGDEINDYATAAAVAGGASTTHTYTVTAAKTLLLQQIEATGSGKVKMEVSVETGVASGVYNTKFVQFNSTAETNMSIHLAAPITVAAGVRVRVILLNRDNQPQDLYSTISGVEV